MYILLRQPLFLLVCSLVLVCVFIGLLVPSPVRADVGVQPILPGGSNIQSEGDTPIQMAAEKVILNVRLATEADNALIELNPVLMGFKFNRYGFAPSQRWKRISG